MGLGIEGVVDGCVDNSPEGACQNFKVAGESIVSLTWPGLSLEVPTSTAEGAERLSPHALFGTVDVRHLGALVLNVPKFSTLNLPALTLSLAAIVAMFRFKVWMIPTLTACSAAGVAYYFANGIP